MIRCIVLLSLQNDVAVYTSKEKNTPQIRNGDAYSGIDTIISIRSRAYELSKPFGFAHLTNTITIRTALFGS